MTKDEMKNRISMALKDPILQQGFEIICKENAELEKENSRLNQIILGNEEEITDLRKDCEEYSKTFNRQNDEIISLRKELIELKNQIHEMRCCDNCCHCGGYTDEGGNSICDSCDDDMSEWEF